MRILHTSDFHLRTNNDEKWFALKEVLELGRREGIEVMVVSGDFFDRKVDVEILRTPLRQLFEQYPFQILILPGNHDYQAFREGYVFGDNVKIFLHHFDPPWEKENVAIWGYPYSLHSEEKILENLFKLKNLVQKEKINILLIHAELKEALFTEFDSGEEEERYMRVSLEYFRDLPFHYILAGHFHTRFNFWNIAEDKYFVYSGTPVSQTRREIGKRKVNLFEVGGEPTEVELNTFHYQVETLTFSPFEEKDPFERIKEIVEVFPPYAESILILEGFIDSGKTGWTEKKLKEAVENITAGKRITLIFNVQDISAILEHGIFKKFQEKLKEKGYLKEEKEELLKILINAFLGKKLCELRKSP